MCMHLHENVIYVVEVQGKFSHLSLLCSTTAAAFVMTLVNAEQRESE